MNDHDIIVLATKYGSWFGNTLEIRKDNLLEAAKLLQEEAYRRGFDSGKKMGYTQANLDAVDRGEQKW